jgi:hypothetical protein
MKPELLELLELLELTLELLDSDLHEALMPAGGHWPPALARGRPALALRSEQFRWARDSSLAGKRKYWTDRRSARAPPPGIRPK